MFPILKKLFESELKEREIELNEEQEDLIDQFLLFYKHKPNSPTAFLIMGGAGSGKTFIINLLRSFLEKQGKKVILLAPTGRAAKVVSAVSKKFASTIHRIIYTPTELPGGQIVFSLKENKDKGDCYYIVDEASMVGNERGSIGGSEGLLADLKRYVYENNSQRKLIFVGDDFQLPPVGVSNSPALDEDYLTSTFDLEVECARLKQIVRQKEASPILKLAGMVREAIDNREWPEIELPTGDGLQELEDPSIAAEVYTSLFESGYLEKVVLITYSNNWAFRFNVHIRNLLFEAEEILIPHDQVMIVRNNYNWGGKKFPFIANGEMATISKVFSSEPELRYGLQWMDVEIEFIDLEDRSVLISGKVILDLLQSKDAQLSYDKLRQVYRERITEYEKLAKGAKMKAIKTDPYMNALQIKYAYAVTGHKSQGGQWKHVIACFESLYPGMDKQDYLRWAYTVITRAQENLYLYKFPFSN